MPFIWVIYFEDRPTKFATFRDHISENTSRLEAGIKILCILNRLANVNGMNITQDVTKKMLSLPLD